MCEPTTIIAVAGLAIAAAGAGASVYGQQEQQRSTARFQNDSVAAADATAKADFQQKTGQAQQAIIQGDAQSNEKIDQNNIQAAQAKAKARLGAAEGGVTGNSVDALFADFDAQSATYNGSVKNNADNNRDQYKYDMLGLRSGGQSYLNGYNFAPLGKVDYLGAGAQLAGGGLQAYDRYQINKKPDTNKGG